MAVIEGVVSPGLRLPTELYEVIRTYAFEHRLSINAVLVQAVKEWVERQGKATAEGNIMAKHDISSPAAGAIADALGCSMADLLTWDTATIVDTTIHVLEVGREVAEAMAACIHNDYTAHQWALVQVWAERR
jgi:hypothetical protein